MAVLGLCLLLGNLRAAEAQLSFERAPINYTTAKSHDPVAELQRRINAGNVTLKFDEEHGYLKSVLEELGVSGTSQMLVFSKTSFQLRHISPWSPRALYFNDENYIGWVQNGDVMEFSSVDPELGAVFYTLRQQESKRPEFVRDKGNCLACHASSRTHGVPGHLVRSVYPAPSGQPHFGSGTFTTTHASPLSQRWGGWYVTGTHGNQRHMGNVLSQDKERPENLDFERGANVTDLSSRARVANYLTRHSDIVALMVLEHQADMHNRITHAAYEGRTALHHNATMNEMFQQSNDHVSESTQRRLKNAAEKVVKYMLFSEEAELTDEITGTASFAEQFAETGPFDKQGRSLRQFDLKRRLFKYPCSYLIYSDAFESIPNEVKERIYRRLWEVLTEVDKIDTFRHLSSDDRQAVLEILVETKSGLPDYWMQ